MKGAASTPRCAKPSDTRDFSGTQTNGDSDRLVAISGRREGHRRAHHSVRAFLVSVRSALRRTLLMMYPTAWIAATSKVPNMLAVVALTLALGFRVSAQQSPTPPLAPAQAMPGPNTGQVQQEAPTETVQGGLQQVQVIFSPWAKYCAYGLTEQISEIRSKEVCFTAADGHVKSGQKLVIALLIEPKGADTKLLRVTLPLGVALVPGARIVIDEKEAMTAPFVVCLSQNGCMADYKADADLIEKLKNGRTLAIQAFDKGKPISFTLPLTGFAKAYEGPVSDPTALQEGLTDDVRTRSEDDLVAPNGK